jgi:hypothetical protein
VDAATMADEQVLGLVMAEGAGRARAARDARRPAPLRARAEVRAPRAIVDPAQQAPQLLVGPDDLARMPSLDRVRGEGAIK